MSSFLRVMFSLFTRSKTKEEVKLGILLINTELMQIKYLDHESEDHKIVEDEIKKLMDEYDLDCVSHLGVTVRRINNKIVFE